MTIGGDDPEMRPRLQTLVRTAAATAAACLALAGAALAADPSASLPQGWSHAEINVLVKGRPHTLIFDRGRVRAVDSASLTIRERDGSVVTVAVAPKATVKINGRPASLANVRRGSTVVTRRIDGRPAGLVRVVRR
jgi:hypothetical protein